MDEEHRKGLQHPLEDNGIPKPVMHSRDGVSLRDYIDLRFEDSQRAIDRAERTMSQRLDGMNEFRESLKDQASRFITRAEMDLRIASVCADVHSLEKRLGECISRSEWEVKHEGLDNAIHDLQGTRFENKGKASQNSLLFTAAVAVVSLILGLIRLFVK